MTVKKLDSTGQATVNATVLRHLERALKAIGVKVASLTPGTSDATSYVAMLEFKLMDEAAPGVPDSPEAKAFKLYAKNFGMVPEDLGQTFVFNNTQYRLAGLVPNRPKYPILAIRVMDDKRFKLPAQPVADILKGKRKTLKPSESASVFADIETPVQRPEIDGGW